MQQATNGTHGWSGADPPARASIRRLHLAWIAIALVGAALFAAACGGDSGTPSSATSPSASVQEQATAFAQCMRSHGVPSFPDPNSQGQFAFTNGSGVDPNSSEFQSARSACQHLLPAGSSLQQSQNQSQALKFAQCMRSHGVPNFPDPQTQGGGTFFGGGGINPSSPQFQNAMQACRSLLPAGAGGGG